MKLQIINFALTETGTSDDMTGTNFTSAVTTKAINNFNERTQGGVLNTPEILAGLAGSIIQQDIANSRMLNIENGWATERFRFVLVMGYPNETIQSTTRYIYTGYTNFKGFNPHVRDFDPNMRIYFNNAISISQTFRQNPDGTSEPIVHVTDISHLLTPGSSGGGLNFITNPVTMQMEKIPSTLRPSDLFTHLANEARRRENFGEHIVSGSTMFDTKKSNRINTIPSMYLASTVDALNTAEQSSDPNSNEQTLYSRAAGNVNDLYIWNDPLISELCEYGYSQNGFITWQTMRILFPYVDKVTKLNLRKGDIQPLTMHGGDQYLLRRGENEYLVRGNTINVSPNALIATTLMQSVVGLMLNNFVARCVIRATNILQSGAGIHVEVNQPFPITDIPQGFLISKIPILQNQLRSMIFKDLPVGLDKPFFIEMHIDAFGESFVRVDYNGSGPVPFGIPSYCDAMMSPLLAPSQQPLQQISHDIRYLIGGHSYGASY